jgi:hypothetical protein
MVGRINSVLFMSRTTGNGKFQKCHSPSFYTTFKYERHLCANSVDVASESVTGCYRLPLWHSTMKKDRSDDSPVWEDRSPHQSPRRSKRVPHNRNEKGRDPDRPDPDPLLYACATAECESISIAMKVPSDAAVSAVYIEGTVIETSDTGHMVPDCKNPRRSPLAAAVKKFQPTGMRSTPSPVIHSAQEMAVTAEALPNASKKKKNRLRMAGRRRKVWPLPDHSSNRKITNADGKALTDRLHSKESTEHVAKGEPFSTVNDESNGCAKPCETALRVPKTVATDDDPTAPRQPQSSSTSAAFPFFYIHGIKVSVVDADLKIFVVDLLTPEKCHEIVRRTDEHVARVERDYQIQLHHYWAASAGKASPMPSTEQSAACGSNKMPTKKTSDPIRGSSRPPVSRLAGIEGRNEAIVSVNVMGPPPTPRQTWRKLYTYTELDMPCREVPGLMHHPQDVVNGVLTDITNIIGLIENHLPFPLAQHLHPRSRDEPHLLKYQNIPNAK